METNNPFRLTVIVAAIAYLAGSTALAQRSPCYGVATVTHRIDGHLAFGEPEEVNAWIIEPLDVNSDRPSGTDVMPDYTFPEFAVTADGKSPGQIDIVLYRDDPSCADFCGAPDSVRMVYVDLDTYETGYVTDHERNGRIEVLRRTPTSIQLRFHNPTVPPTAEEGAFRLVPLAIEEYKGGCGWEHLQDVTLTVYPPPVVLTHGLWSNGNSMSELEAALPHPYFLKRRTDYADAHAASFADNDWIVKAQVNFLIRVALHENVVCGGVDLVGHSMGGLLSRQYVQGLGVVPYENDVCRVVTINTPHAGSQGANVIDDPDVYGFVDGLLAGLEYDPYGGAVHDLAVGSDALADLNAAGFPGDVGVHAIATTAEPPGEPAGLRGAWQLSGLAGFWPWVPMLSECNGELLQQLYREPESDLVVALSSQYGGLSGGNVSTYAGQPHVGSPAFAPVKARVADLLRRPVDDPAFALGGFSPPTLEYRPDEIDYCVPFLAPDGPGAAFAKTQAPAATGIRFELLGEGPEDFPTLRPHGSVVTFYYSGGDAAEIQEVVLVMANGFNSWVYQRGIGGSDFFNIRLPQHVVGRVPAVAIAYRFDGSADTVQVPTVVVDFPRQPFPNACPRGLQRVYPERMYVGVGARQSISYEALYCDGVTWVDETKRLGWRGIFVEGADRASYSRKLVVGLRPGEALLRFADGDWNAEHEVELTVIGESRPLPLAWRSFEAAADGDRARLAWRTADEYDLRHFRVERSRDGERWRTLATVTPDGRGAAYRHEDRPPPGPPTYYYRIRAVDEDGSYDFTDARAVTLARDGGPDRPSLVANVVAAGATLQFRGPAGGTSAVTLSDAVGRTLARRSFAGTAASWPLPPHVGPGVYALTFADAAGRPVVTRRLVVE